MRLTPPAVPPASVPAPVRDAIAGPDAGSPLSPAVAAVVGPGLGVDPAPVRVHTDARAATATAHLGVRAFTWGADVYLASGERPDDVRLIAHEVTHAVQQSGGPAVQPFGGGSGTLEREAHSAASVVACGGRTTVTGRTGGGAVQGWWNPIRAAADAISDAASWVKDKALAFIKEHARDVPGYDLLAYIIGRDPITQDPVERNFVNLIKGVVGLAPGGHALFENLERTKVISRAGEWLSTEYTKLGITWSFIRGLFSRAWDELSVSDIAHPIRAWEKIKNIFGPPLRRVGEFVLAVGRKLLEFVFEGAIALGGGAAQQVIAVFRRIGAVFGLIVTHPLEFLGNLVKAVKGGFDRFRSRILDHLKAGLFRWLTGALPGVTMPSTWNFAGVLGLLLQVLNLSYSALRGVLVTVIGEPATAVIETLLDFVITVVTKGLPAAWEKIKEFASGLTDTVLGGIRDWIQKSVVGAAVTKLVTLFNPVGALIQGIITIYNTIMFFLERIEQIKQMVNSVLDSIETIAKGNLAAAIGFVETAMANSLPVIIGFLARFAGLGNVTKYVREIIEKIQGTVRGALTKVGLWVKGKVLGVLGVGGDKPAGAVGPVGPTFRIGKEEHRIRVDLKPGSGRVLMASDAEELVTTKLDVIRAHIVHWQGGSPEQKAMAGRLSARLAQVEARLTTMVAQIQKLPPADAVRLIVNAISADIRVIGEEFGLPGLKWVDPVHRFVPKALAPFGRAREIEAWLCMDSWRKGSPSSGLDIPGIRLRKGYQRGHLLANALGGRGDINANLTPISPATNRNMRDYAEKMARENLDGRQGGSPTFDPTNVIHYRVECTFPDPAPLDAWLVATLKMPPGSYTGFFLLAQHNRFDAGTADAWATKSGGRKPTDAEFGLLAERLADTFLARTITVRTEPLQGKALTGPSYPVDNHM